MCPDTPHTPRSIQIEATYQQTELWVAILMLTLNSGRLLASTPPKLPHLRQIQTCSPTAMPPCRMQHRFPSGTVLGESPRGVPGSCPWTSRMGLSFKQGHQQNLNYTQIPWTSLCLGSFTEAVIQFKSACAQLTVLGPLSNREEQFWGVRLSPMNVRR